MSYVRKATVERIEVTDLLPHVAMNDSEKIIQNDKAPHQDEIDVLSALVLSDSTIRKIIEHIILLKEI